MDVETLLLIGAAVTGIVVGVLHLLGYVPPRYRRMLAEVQHSTAQAITEALEAQISRFTGGEGGDGPDPLVERLDALAARLEAFTPEAVGAAVGAELNKLQEAAMKAMNEVPAEITGAMGGMAKSANVRTREAKEAVGEGLLGPYGGILQQVMPPLYDYLVQNPDMVLEVLSWPSVQKAIQSGARMLGNVTGSLSPDGGGGGGWR